MIKNEIMIELRKIRFNGHLRFVLLAILIVGCFMILQGNFN